ncbi:hypothetical protein PR048_001811 [Dryococelus australis]|uniref:Uncharacterized protein n=1 Tax=Dryococelus australis TaxID=614101 RepID=A0ABQ9IJ39_9NEOP|nr:hypothetical protein PR048_001811 [Dryococelus australis]
MLERLVHLREYAAAELASSNSPVECLNIHEWMLAEPVAQATNDLSGDRYESRCLVTPFLHYIESSLQNCIASSVNGKVFAKNKPHEIIQI